MKKVIITGANGFVGRLLTKKMVENGVNVLAVSRSFHSDFFPDNALINKVELNIQSANDLLSSIPIDEYDAFYHLAWSGVNGPDKADPIVQSENLKIAISCADAAKQLKCKKFLCAGTVAELSVNSLSNLDKVSGGMMYGIAKHCTHLFLETYCKYINLEFVWMQFSNIYGPANKTGNLISYTLSMLLNGHEATFGPAQQMYDFIFADDLVEAIYRLGQNKTNKTKYFIGSGEPRILQEYLLEIGNQCGRPDLIKIGKRPDDGIEYSLDMFDVKALKTDVGEYISMSFSDAIRYTIDNY